MHYGTSQIVVGSIPDGVIEIFHRHNPSSRTMTLGLTQPLTEMSTRYISCGVKAAGAYCCFFVYLGISMFLSFVFTYSILSLGARGGAVG